MKSSFRNKFQRDDVVPELNDMNDAVQMPGISLANFREQRPFCLSMNLLRSESRNRLRE